MNKFEKLSKINSKIYYKYFLFGITNRNDFIGELCIDTKTNEIKITKLAKKDTQKSDICVHARALIQNNYPEKYTYAYC